MWEDWLAQLAAIANPGPVLNRLNTVASTVAPTQQAFQNEVAGLIAPITQMPTATPQQVPGGMVPANPEAPTFGPQPSFGEILYPRQPAVPSEQLQSPWLSEDTKKKLAALGKEQQELLLRMMPARQEPKAPVGTSPAVGRGLNSQMAQVGPMAVQTPASVIPTLAMLLAGQPYRRT